MRPFREAMIREQREIKPFGVHYNALSMVVAATDAVATVLGHSEHYLSKGSAPRDQRPSDQSPTRPPSRVIGLRRRLMAWDRRGERRRLANFDFNDDLVEGDAGLDGCKLPQVIQHGCDAFSVRALCDGGR
jgi:hypothetical protein